MPCHAVPCFSPCRALPCPFSDTLRVPLPFDPSRVCQYNAVLRGKQCNAPEFALRRLEGLCGDNLYVTTIHVINTALVSLSSCTRRTTVYRGMSGVAMPRCFHEPDETGLQGGVELGCLSTTRDANIAFDYAAGDGGLVLEIRQGENDRGADFAWLSQYPHEAEITFPPRACTASDSQLTHAHTRSCTHTHTHAHTHTHTRTRI